MNRNVSDNHAGSGPKPGDESNTGLPLLRNWRAVYIFVTACFAVWVAILALLPRVFS